MMKKKLSFLLIIFITIGCVKDIDVNQVKDLSSIKPVYTVSLLNYNVKAVSFKSKEVLITKKVSFPIFKKAKIGDKLKKIDIETTISNPFDRELTLIISLLDSNNQVTYTAKNIEIKPKKLNNKHRETIILTNNSSVFKTQYIKATLRSSASGLIAIKKDSLIVKSVGTFYFNVNLK